MNIQNIRLTNIFLTASLVIFRDEVLSIFDIVVLFNSNFYLKAMFY